MDKASQSVPTLRLTVGLLAMGCLFIGIVYLGLGIIATAGVQFVGTAVDAPDCRSVMRQLLLGPVYLLVGSLLLAWWGLTGEATTWRIVVATLLASGIVIAVLTSGFINAVPLRWTLGPYLLGTLFGVIATVRAARLRLRPPHGCLTSAAVLSFVAGLFILTTIEMGKSCDSL